MKAVILAAGKGTRLPEISNIIPKPMIPFNGKPLLEKHIEYLKSYGINEIYINLHHFPEKITNYFGNGSKFNIHIEYSFEEKLLGTGGALLAFAPKLNDETVILFGDILTTVNLKKMLLFHKKNNSSITAAIHKSSHPIDSDLVIFDKKFLLNKILSKPHKYIPKNPYNLAGLYILNPSVLTKLKKETPFDIAHDVIPLFLKEKFPLYCYNTDEMLMDIGTPERLEKAQKVISL